MKKPIVIAIIRVLVLNFAFLLIYLLSCAVYKQPFEITWQGELSCLILACFLEFAEVLWKKGKKKRRGR